MNFYKHHIGDYAQATAHLSFVEDAAYSRLIRKYYAEEKALPADVKLVTRLVGARTREERDAVRAVLDEFFVLEEDGWHNKRCDAEIGKANAQADTNRRIAEDREARKRARAEHETSHAQSTNRSPAPAASVNLARLQTPDTRLQTEIQERAADPPPLRARSPDDPEEPGQPTAAGAVCRAMRQAGLQAVNPGDPRLLALLEQGATEAEFVGIAAEAVAKSKGWAWVLTVLQARRGEAATIVLAPVAADPNAWRKTEIGVRRMSQQLGVGGPREGEMFDVWERRVLTAWQRAGEPPPKPLEAA